MNLLTESVPLLFAQATKAPDAPLLPKLETGWAIVIGAMLLLLAALVLVLYGTRVGIIARATVKEAVRQPMFSLALLISLFLLLLNTFWPFFSLGEDYKMLKDCGLATILFSGLLLAIWTSSTSVADEIEGKTAMTLLSKPINRRQFILGKYVGILTSSLILMAPQALVLLGLIFYKFLYYDSRESSRDDVTAAMAMKEVLQVIPGILLIFMEISVLSAVSVAISTRAPMVINLVASMAIFVVGHLTPSLVGQSVAGMELVFFMAQMIAAVLPSLSVFNIEAAVATGDVVPPSYLGWSALYTCVYGVMAVLLSFILFEDRDLA